MKQREPVIKKHRHHWKWASRRGDFIEFRCNRDGCDARKPERKMTPHEIKRFKAQDAKSQAERDQMHSVGWDFQKTFYKYKRVEVNPELRKKFPKMYKSKYQDVRDGWKWTSYTLMTRVREWAKKYPEDVIVCRIDDSFFASSDLVFILHRVKRRLWGTTVVVIPQCDGQPPCEYFMYPSHREGIQKALEKMSKFERLR